MVLHLRGKRRLCGLERYKLAVQFFEGLVSEPCADASDVMPNVVSRTARTSAPKNGRDRFGAVKPAMTTS